MIKQNPNHCFFNKGMKTVFTTILSPTAAERTGKELEDNLAINQY